MNMTELEGQAKIFQVELKEFNNYVVATKTKQDMLIQKKENIENKIQKLNINLMETASIILKELVQNQREIASKELSKLGTLALQYSLGPNNKMEIEIEDTSSNPKAYVWFIKDGSNKESPLDDNGGGVVDIIGTSLRLVIMNNYDDPPIDGPAIFDEPFKMVSKDYIPQLSEFISNISRDFGRQIIVVTHNDFLSSMTDSNVYVSLDNNDNSQIEVMNNGSNNNTQLQRQSSNIDWGEK